MPDIMSDIETAESEWEGPVPVVMKEEPPEMSLAIKAERVFEAQILPLSAVRKRRAELGVENAALCTREQRDAMSTINGMWRKINGQVDKVGKFLKDDALKVQRTVNELMKKVKGEVAREQKPILDKFEEWDAEDEAAEQAKIQAQRDAEEAERKAAQAIEDAKRAAEVEANRKEAERLNAEKAILDAERRAHEVKVMAEQKAIQEAQRIEREKLAAEKAEFEAAKRAAAKIESDKTAKIAADKAAEEAEKQRIALEAAEKFQREQAAEKERLRQEAMEPDIPKLRRLAAAINLTEATAPEVESHEAKETMRWARGHLKNIANQLLKFGTK